MNKYVVKVVNLFSNIVEVEAEDENGAREAAKANLVDSNNDEQFQHFYESTLPEEHWAVITKEKYEELKAEVEKSLEESSANTNEEASNIVTPNIITP